MGRERRQKSIVATESFGQARGTSAYDQVSEPLQSARTPASRRRGRGEPHLVEYFMATLAAKGVDFARRACRERIFLGMPSGLRLVLRLLGRNCVFLVLGVPRNTSPRTAPSIYFYIAVSGVTPRRLSFLGLDLRLSSRLLDAPPITPARN